MLTGGSGEPAAPAEHYEPAEATLELLVRVWSVVTTLLKKQHLSSCAQGMQKVHTLQWKGSGLVGGGVGHCPRAATLSAMRKTVCAHGGRDQGEWSEAFG